VDPTGGFQDRTCVAARVVKLAIAAIGIGLEDFAVAGQMRLRMFAGTIA
jgi:predicted metal-binding protein